MTICYFDIETRKHAVPPGLTSRGRPVTLRWQCFMIGYAIGNARPYLLEDEYEGALWAAFEGVLRVHHVTEIVYGATRKFDEAIARGTFINARREFLDEPGPWPHLDTKLADKITWTNIGPEANPDGLSKLVPQLYVTNPAKVRKHCLEDIIILRRRHHAA